jgi:hypothetical protein
MGILRAQSIKAWSLLVNNLPERHPGPPQTVVGAPMERVREAYDETAGANAAGEVVRQYTCQLRAKRCI